MMENSPTPNLLTIKDVKGVMKGVDVVYIMLNKSEYDVQMSTIPDQVKQLLSEFQDVFPFDLPSGLPPMREIQH